jgi:hypothetical protein
MSTPHQNIWHGVFNEENVTSEIFSSKPEDVNGTSS